MKLAESEDFNVFYRNQNFGRFIVNSPYEIDIEKELKESADTFDNFTISKFLSEKLREGIISKFEPNYTVEINIFDEVYLIKN